MNTPKVIEADSNLLATLTAEFPELAFFNEEAMTGLAVSQPPSIGLNGTRFVVKEGGEEKTLNQLTIACVVLRAKANMDKVWYATGFTPGQEPKMPDCFSTNGAAPDPQSVMKQCENCAGCAQNQFGTAKDQNGNFTKGKACTDSKIIAIFTNGTVYKFKIPPASLKNFAAYVKSLTARNIPLAACQTAIGFDPGFSYPVLTFSFDGMLAAEQVRKVVGLISSEEVMDIINTPAPKMSLPAPKAAEPVAAPAKEEVIEIAAPVSSLASKRAATKPAPVETAKPANTLSDDDIAAELGL
jgi:hypothetical protein